MVMEAIAEFLQLGGLSLTQGYFGSSLEQYLYFAGFILLSFIMSKVFTYLVFARFKQLAEQTDNKVDDFIVAVFEGPVFFFIPLIGFFVGFYFFLTPDPPSVTDTVNNLGVSVFLALLAWSVWRAVDASITLYVKPLASKTDSRLDDQLIPILTRVSKFIILIIFGITILSTNKIEVLPALAGLGIGGLALAFAANKTLSDVFGGISIFTSKPFVVGDFVDIGGTKGTVEEVGLRYTRLRTIAKRRVILPNGQAAESVITNYSNMKTRVEDVNIGLVYGTTHVQLEKAKKILKEVVESHKNCENNPGIWFTEFQDSSINVLLRYTMKDPSKWRETVDYVNTEIKKRFDKAKLDFAFPSQSIYLEKN